MRRPLLALTALALPLAGCGPKTLALSEEPVTRAAQCAAVSAAAARAGQTDVKAPLPFATQATILQHALIVGTEGQGYDEDRAQAVLKALPAAGETITTAKWQPLEAECATAFPETRAPVKLPANTLDAQLGCSLLADYVIGAMRSQEGQYGEAMTPLRRMRMDLDNRIGARLHGAGKGGEAAQKVARAKAMNAIVHAGASPGVLDACVERFGTKA